MSTLTFSDTTYEIVDEQARAQYQSEGENSFATNDSVVAIAPYSSAHGFNNIAGYKGFHIKYDFTDTDGNYYLVVDGNPQEVYTIGDKLCIKASRFYYNEYIIDGFGGYFSTAVSGEWIDNAICIGNLENIEKVVLKKEGDMEDWLWVEGKPYGNTIKAFQGAFASGEENIVLGWGSASFGRGNKVLGNYGCAFGRDNEVSYGSFAAGRENIGKGEYGFMAGFTNVVNAHHASALGQYNVVDAEDAFALGNGNYVSGVAANARGKWLHALANYSSLEGGGKSADYPSIASKSSKYAHLEGYFQQANGFAVHLEGQQNIARGIATHVEGQHNIGNAGQHVGGKYNIEDTDGIYSYILGNGTSETKRSNAHTVDWNGNAWYQGSVTSNGADYAEYFEWLDGNSDNEDRVGFIVTLDGEKIRLANAGEEVLGIVSGTAAVLGDNYECEWNGKYLTDDFGRVIYDMVEEFVEIPHTEVDEEGNIIERIETVSCGFFKHPRINPNYDPTQEYVNRADRPEWDTVGMLGKLYVRDDGTCTVNGYATVGENGVATASSEKTNMRVLSRVNENVVRVLLK